ncbi:hypothetical protein HUJ04_006244 [Dendroctonus ponderosae]|nr:hypothetical protein HUJ04_006244 [Dendroctonus ponderosae]
MAQLPKKSVLIYLSLLVLGRGVVSADENCVMLLRAADDIFVLQSKQRMVFSACRRLSMVTANETSPLEEPNIAEAVE